MSTPKHHGKQYWRDQRRKTYSVRIYIVSALAINLLLKKMSADFGEEKVMQACNCGLGNGQVVQKKTGLVYGIVHPVTANTVKCIILILGSALIGLIGFLDWRTAQRFSLYVSYSIPISVGAWFASRHLGILFCFISVLTWMVVDLHLSAWEAWTVLWNAGLRLCFFCGISIVISSLKYALEHEKARAGTDFLTELPNRRTFFIIANQQRQHALRHKRPITLAYVDLDDFKQINDRSGHDIGDLLLKEVALVLLGSTRGSDTVARIGGDEFVLLLPETNYESGQVALHKLKESLNERMRDRHWDVSISIGAVTYTDHFPEVNEMVVNADRLMYTAKASGKNRIRHEFIT